MDKYDISQLFNKKFRIRSSTNIPQTAFKSQKWSMPELQEKKHYLNEVKSRLSKYDLEKWSKYTKHNDPSSLVIRNLKQKIEPELVTQAWCKFYECLCQFEIIPKFMPNNCKYRSLHLCEAPGAFIAALNHFINSNCCLDWTWNATTLNPEYEGNKLTEMIPDDRLLRFTREKWYFGPDATGDITKYHNYCGLLDYIKEKVHLVTADGSIDCMIDPGNQENSVGYLLYCEVITALSILMEGGTFVLKIFTIFEDLTICLLYILSLSFGCIEVFKPSTSKGGNSEVYIVCTNFKGLEILDKMWYMLKGPYHKGYFDNNKSMFDLDELPSEFLEDVENCAEFFMNLQIETILHNIKNFGNDNSVYLSKLYNIKKNVAKMYMKNYHIKRILPNFRLVPFENINSYNFKAMINLKHSTRYIIKDLIHPLRCSKSLVIKYGQEIGNVNFSNFCNSLHCRNIFNVFDMKDQREMSLYYKAHKELSKTHHLIINKGDFNRHSYRQFQRDFFNFFINNNLKENLIILNIPLVTNFLVGFFHILCSFYEEILIHQGGAIILCGLKIQHVQEFNNIIAFINKSYSELPFNVNFEVDIIGIVPTELLLYNEMHNIIYNYNNLLLSKVKRY